jgi:endonuclease YncB( thermonuclease family)
MVRGVAGIIAASAVAAMAAGLCLPAWACDLPPPAETGMVADVLDGDTLKLTDGRIVRQIGAKAPKPPLSWRGDDPWPLVDEAKAALSALASGKPVELRFGGQRQDRHGYLLAQVFVVEDGTRLWLQDELIGKGLARVYSFADNRVCVAELLTREAAARAKQRGVGGSYVYRIEAARDAKRLGRLIHSYQLIEGTVVAVGEGAGRLYLNFGPDWRSDFTVSIDRKNVSAFAAAGIDVRALAGRRLRARGFLGWRGGPMIDATHPEQIELLPANPTEGRAQPPSGSRTGYRSPAGGVS